MIRGYVKVYKKIINNNKKYNNMALQLDFEQEGIIYRKCYLRIHKIRTHVSEYEFFENVETDDDIVQELSWKSKLETTATVYVWDSLLGRTNRARPLKQFGFDFEYDLLSGDNIYRQAYESLKTSDKFMNVSDV